MKTHPCANPHCTAVISARLLACPHDWWKLPGELRHEVTASYADRLRNPAKNWRRHALAVGEAVKWFRANLAPAPAPTSHKISSPDPGEVCTCEEYRPLRERLRVTGVGATVEISGLGLPPGPADFTVSETYEAE